MSSELTVQAARMFDTSDKWASFVELSDLRGEITARWYRQFKVAADDYFLGNPVDGWGYTSWGTNDMRWYLSKFTDNSFSPGLGWNLEFHLRTWGNGQTFDYQKLALLLVDAKYAPLVRAVDRREVIQEQGVVREIRNFEFGDPLDGMLTPDRLAWYAGNRTEDLLLQVRKKIDRFRADPYLTRLLAELNRDIRKA